MVKKDDIAVILPLENNSCHRLLNSDARSHVSCNVNTVESGLRKQVNNHSLPYLTFICVLNGGGKLVLDGLNFDMQPGLAFIRYPNKIFSITRSEDYVEFSIALPPDFGTLLKKYVSDRTLCTLRPLDTNTLKSMRNIFDFCRDTPDDKLLTFAAEAFKYIVGLHFKPESNPICENELFIERACRLLIDNNGINSPGRETAQKMGLGYESFRKKFKTIMKISPKQYVSKQNFYKAATMLSENLSIKEVADKMGYSEIPAFSRQFKKHFSVSPSEYRKTARHDFY
ncbi:MAG: AraC family transcriptional regulator [Victivallaceae bacterium]